MGVVRNGVPVIGHLLHEAAKLNDYKTGRQPVFLMRNFEASASKQLGKDIAKGRVQWQFPNINSIMASEPQPLLRIDLIGIDTTLKKEDYRLLDLDIPRLRNAQCRVGLHIQYMVPENEIEREQRVPAASYFSRVRFASIMEASKDDDFVCRVELDHPFCISLARLESLIPHDSQGILASYNDRRPLVFRIEVDMQLDIEAYKFLHKQTANTCLPSNILASRDQLEAQYSINTSMPLTKGYTILRRVQFDYRQHAPSIGLAANFSWAYRKASALEEANKVHRTSSGTEKIRKSKCQKPRKTRFTWADCVYERTGLVCPICNAKLTQVGALKVHMRINHSYFSCEVRVEDTGNDLYASISMNADAFALSLEPTRESSVERDTARVTGGPPVTDMIAVETAQKPTLESTVERSTASAAAALQAVETIAYEPARKPTLKSTVASSTTSAAVAPPAADTRSKIPGSTPKSIVTSDSSTGRIEHDVPLRNHETCATTLLPIDKFLKRDRKEAQIERISSGRQPPPGGVAPNESGGKQSVEEVVNSWQLRSDITPIRGSCTPLRALDMPVQESDTPLQTSGATLQESGTTLPESSTTLQKSNLPHQKSATRYATAMSPVKRPLDTHDHRSIFAKRAKPNVTAIEETPTGQQPQMPDCMSLFPSPAFKLNTQYGKAETKTPERGRPIVQSHSELVDVKSSTIKVGLDVVNETPALAAISPQQEHLPVRPSAAALSSATIDSRPSLVARKSARPTLTVWQETPSSRKSSGNQDFMNSTASATTTAHRPCNPKRKSGPIASPAVKPPLPPNNLGRSVSPTKAKHSITPIPKVVRPKFAVPAGPSGITFFKTTSKRILREGELTPESDDEVLEEPLRRQHHQILAARQDLSADELEFLRRYDDHFMKEHITGERYVSDAVLRFVNKNKSWLAGGHNSSRLAIFAKKAAELTSLNVLRNDCIRDCFVLIRNAQGAATVDAAGTIANDVVRKKEQLGRREQCFCGERVMHLPKGIKCAAYDCARESFHLRCVGLERRVGGWRCDDCQRHAQRKSPHTAAYNSMD